MSRLASEFWVKAYLKTLSLRGISAFVTARGDDQAGAILIKLAPLDGPLHFIKKGSILILARQLGQYSHRLMNLKSMQ